MKARAQGPNSWWPSDLGNPSIHGSSNGFRYAYFAVANRLAVDDGKEIKLYDTGEKLVAGFSASDGLSLTVHTQNGPMKLKALKLIERS